MQLKELFAIARKAYGHKSEDEMGRHLNETRDTIVPDPQGDPLALFLLQELQDTYDEAATPQQQLKEAARVMRMAKSDVNDVMRAFEGHEPTPNKGRVRRRPETFTRQ